MDRSVLLLWGTLSQENYGIKSNSYSAATRGIIFRFIEDFLVYAASSLYVGYQHTQGE